ncbi:hypothetical protein NKY68_12310 [Sinorhizobium meliloti]|uniref:hypothetical protein n=1 Tax=Rhizobium meliloti TaxID=382 RepID=UPI003D65C25D
MTSTDVRKLRNLLGRLSERLERMQRYTQNLKATYNIEDLRQEISHLSRLVGVMDLRADQLTLDDLDALRDGVARINSLSSIPELIREVRYTTDVHKSARAALQEDCNFLRNTTIGLQIGINLLDPGELEDLIPNQKVAAYQFAFKDEKIVVVDQLPPSSEPDSSLSAAANEVLVEQGQRILTDLQGSNCSPRLIQAFVALQGKLAEHKNVVQIGMLNSACSKITIASAEELSTTLLELLKAHVEGVYDYLAQDPNWRIFVEHSVSVKLERKDIDELAATARALATRLEAADGAAEESVPAALRTVADLTEISAKPDGRLTLALARTIENMVSLVTRVAAALKEDVFSEARKWTARVVLGSVAGAAMIAIAKVPGAEWIPETISYLLGKMGVK